MLPYTSKGLERPKSPYKVWGRVPTQVQFYCLKTYITSDSDGKRAIRTFIRFTVLYSLEKTTPNENRHMKVNERANPQGLMLIKYKRWGEGFALPVYESKCSGKIILLPSGEYKCLERFIVD